MLHKIYYLNLNFNKYFKNYDFHNLYKELLNFCTVDLSSFYFDIRKDTLYCDPKDFKKENQQFNNFKYYFKFFIKMVCTNFIFYN